MFANLLEHAGWNVLALCIAAAQQCGTELCEADTSTLDDALVGRNAFLITC